MLPDPGMENGPAFAVMETGSAKTASRNILADKLLMKVM